MKHNKIGIGILVLATLLVSMLFTTVVSAQEGLLSKSSDVKQVVLKLDQKAGVLYIPTQSKTITNLSTTNTVEKSATANLSGTIDKNNFVTLEGVITLDGESDKVKLSGYATQVFIGWDVPKGAKPIISKISNGAIPLYEGETEIVTYVDPRDNISVDNITITRYEGATELYATYVDLQDKEGKYKLHGEFYKDGVGGIVGKVMKNEVECDLGLLGSSISMYENVSPTATTKSSGSLTVPQRSQWEILWYQHNYIAASQACMETSCAMLEEYYTGQHPAIWDVWVACGSGPANAYEAMDYFYSKGLTWIGVCKFWANTNTVNNCIAHVMTIIDMGRPMILEEKSESGNAHAVVVKGYNYETTDHRFYLNDPNTLTGSNYIWMYHYSYPSFNFEDNVVYWVGADDDHANGYTYLRQ